MCDINRNLRDGQCAEPDESWSVEVWYPAYIRDTTDNFSRQCSANNVLNNDTRSNQNVDGLLILPLCCHRYFHILDPIRPNARPGLSIFVHNCMFLSFHVYIFHGRII